MKLHYAVKANTDDLVVAEMIKLGSCFDCASASEIEQVLRLGGNPDDILFANSCKQVPHIALAREKGVKMMTFDSSEEVYNIHSVFPDAELILRIAVEETDAPCHMSLKFGAPEELWSSILDTCKQMKMKCIGVSFHVGSGGCNYKAYSDSIQNAKKVFKMALAKGMQAMNVLDIGGGFVMNAVNPYYNFDVIAPQITSYINEIFPRNEYKLQLLGEPGRFIS